jgi:hypothetical protein
MSTVRATRDFGFVGRPDGSSVRVDAGDEWDTADPFVVDHPHMFEQPKPARVVPRPGRPARRTP